MPDKHRKKAKPNDDEDFRNRKDKSKVYDSTNDGNDQVNFQSIKTNLKYSLNSNKAAQQKESKPNIVEAGEVNKQPRRVYKYVANNFRFRKKFDSEKPIDH